MEVKELVEMVRGALREGPATFDGVIERTDYRSPGGIGIALGALQAQDEVGFNANVLFVLRDEATGWAQPPFLYSAVLNVLRDVGPGTFQEISDRVGVNQPSEIGFALGWLFGEGKIAICGEQGKGGWCLIEQ